MRILEEFWYGNINPVEIPFQRQRQFDKAFKLLTRNEEKLFETLNEQEKELFDKYRNLMELPFPPLPLGTFKAKLIYRTPGDIYEKGYEIKFKND